MLKRHREIRQILDEVQRLRAIEGLGAYHPKENDADFNMIKAGLGIHLAFVP